MAKTNVCKAIVKQIQSITGKFTTYNILSANNIVREKDGEIQWAGFKDIAYTLKDEPYNKIYAKCVEEYDYNFMMLDKALIQIMYKCEKNKVISHRLAYYPHPYSINFADSPDEYQELFFGTELFAEFIEDKNGVSAPIRFDFDCDPAIHKPHTHTFVHLTLGNYKSCRIPVQSPLSPKRFIHFIMRAYYSNLFYKYFKEDEFKCDLDIFRDDLKDETSFLYIANH